MIFQDITLTNSLSTKPNKQNLRAFAYEPGSYIPKKTENSCIKFRNLYNNYRKSQFTQAILQVGEKGEERRSTLISSFYVFHLLIFSGYKGGKCLVKI